GVFAEARDRARDVGPAPLEARGGADIELLLDDDVAADAVRAQRRLEDGPEEPPLAGVRADVRVADRLRVDDAADDERRAAAAGERRIGEQRVDRASGAALDDLHARGDRAIVRFVRAEAVMVRLARLGHRRIAQLDDAAGDERRRGRGTAERDGNREAR